jgi:hypothetical protein
VPRVIARADRSFERRKRQAGFGYREVASITLVDLDGDARRIIECEELEVADETNPRAKRHPISLPPTDGALAVLRARGHGFGIAIEPPLRSADRPQRFTTELIFDRAVGQPERASYRYDWYAVNAFALDRDQFENRHGPLAQGAFLEFTHYQCLDPTQELAVVVQFPPGFKLDAPPRVRVARSRSDEPDSRRWPRDLEAQRELNELHALRYYESLNMAGLRVSRP